MLNLESAILAPAFLQTRPLWYLFGQSRLLREVIQAVFRPRNAAEVLQEGSLRLRARRIRFAGATCLVSKPALSVFKLAEAVCFSKLYKMYSACAVTSCASQQTTFRTSSELQPLVCFTCLSFCRVGRSLFVELHLWACALSLGQRNC